MSLLLTVPTSEHIFSRVPRVTLVFWILKILATILGESLADNMASRLGFGFLLSTIISAFVFVFFVEAQSRLNSYHTFMYWRTIVATAVLGTSLSDFIVKHSAHGYPGGIMLLAMIVLAYFLIWQRNLGSVSVGSIISQESVYYYWGAILLTQSLGNALGDFVARHSDYFHQGRIVFFYGLIIAFLLAHLCKVLGGTSLFWATFVLTRPIASDLGLLLHLPTHKGGLALTGYGASFAVLLAMVALLVIANPKPDRSIAA